MCAEKTKIEESIFILVDKNDYFLKALKLLLRKCQSANI